MSYLYRYEGVDWIKDIDDELYDNDLSNISKEFKARISYNERIIGVYNLSDDGSYYEKLLITDNASILYCDYRHVDNIYGDRYQISHMETYYYNFALPEYFAALFESCVMFKYLKPNDYYDNVYKGDCFNIDEIYKLISFVMDLEKHTQEKIINAVAIVAEKLRDENALLKDEINELRQEFENLKKIKLYI